MEKRKSFVFSGILISVGIMLLFANLAGVLFGFRLWQLWPLILIAAGLMFVVPPLRRRDQPGLSGLFIPGLQILVTGGISLLASVFRWWNVWELLWPLEVLSVALSFLLMAFFMRNIWLLIPAFIVGANGLLFQFCAFSGWWSVWAVLWVIEPLSVAAAFLVIHARRPTPRLLHSALLLCALAAFGFGLSVLGVIFGSTWWIWKWLMPFVVIAAGIVMLIRPQVFFFSDRAIER